MITSHGLFGSIPAGHAYSGIDGFSTGFGSGTGVGSGLGVTGSAAKDWLFDAFFGGLLLDCVLPSLTGDVSTTCFSSFSPSEKKKCSSCLQL